MDTAGASGTDFPEDSFLDGTERFATAVVGRDRVLWEGLRRTLLASQFDMFCAVAHVAAVSGGFKRKPDLIVRDVPSDTVDLKSEIQHMRLRFPGVRVVAMAERLTKSAFLACVAGGAQGFLKKDIATDVLIRTLHMVMRGASVFPTRLAGQLVNGMVETSSMPLPNANPCQLSKREMQIAQLVVRGESNKIIASRLSISESTVKGHMNNLLRKTKAANRTQAAIWAVRENSADEAIWSRRGLHHQPKLAASNSSPQ